MGKLSITISILLFLSGIFCSIKQKKSYAFHLLLSENVKKSIKHSVHGNKFVWFPEIKLSRSHLKPKINRQELLDYHSLSHIFKKEDNSKNKLLQIKQRRLESVMIREKHSIKGKLHTDETNLHNLKCQCIFREIPQGNKNLAQKKVKIIKSKIKKNKKRIKAKRKQHKRKKNKKPSLKSCLLMKKLTKKNKILCKYFYSDVFSKLNHVRSKKKRKHKRKKKSRLLKFSEKRLIELQKLLKKTSNKHKKKKKSNLVLLEIKN